MSPPNPEGQKQYGVRGLLRAVSSTSRRVLEPQTFTRHQTAPSTTSSLIFMADTGASAARIVGRWRPASPSVALEPAISRLLDAVIYPLTSRRVWRTTCLRIKRPQWDSE
jgi:hypothetical protein